MIVNYMLKRGFLCLAVYLSCGYFKIVFYCKSSKFKKAVTLIFALLGLNMFSKPIPNKLVKKNGGVTQVCSGLHRHFLLIWYASP